MEAKVYWRREKAAVLPSPAAPRRSCPVPVMRLARRIAVTGHDRRRRERTSRMMPAEENEFAAVLLIDAAMVACNFRFVYLEWGGGCCRFGSGQRYDLLLSRSRRSDDQLRLCSTDKGQTNLDESSKALAPKQISGSLPTWPLISLARSLSLGFRHLIKPG